MALIRCGAGAAALPEYTNLLYSHATGDTNNFNVSGAVGQKFIATFENSSNNQTAVLTFTGATIDQQYKFGAVGTYFGTFTSTTMNVTSDYSPGIYSGFIYGD